MATFQLALHALSLADNGAGLLQLDPLFVHENVLAHAQLSHSSARRTAQLCFAHSEKVALLVAGAVIAKDFDRAARLAEHCFKYRMAAEGFEQHARSLIEQIAAEG